MTNPSDPKPKRPYVPLNELPGTLWRKAEEQSRFSRMTLLAVSLAIILTSAVVLSVLGLSSGGRSLAVAVGLISPTPSFTPSNTPTATITPSPTPQNSDDDAIVDDRDNCDFVANPEQKDSDGDGIGDSCDDSDGDTIVDLTDNCPTIANTDQSDLDGDAVGDACDDAINLEGITLELNDTAPLYIGSSDNNRVLEITGESTAPLVLNAPIGGFVTANSDCIPTAPSTYSLNTNETSVKYCVADSASEGQVRLVIREIGNNNQPTGKGGFVVLELMKEIPTVVFEQASILNAVNRNDTNERCFFEEPLGNGTQLEVEGIPFVLRLTTDATSSTRSYPALITMPSGGLYIAERTATECQLLTALDPLTGSPSFNAKINTDYTLYYFPDVSSGTAQQFLSVSLISVGTTPATSPIYPLLIATIPLNVRQSDLGVALTLETDSRSWIVGIGGQGSGRWVQIRVDNNDQELWLNIGQLGGSYRVVGNVDSAPAITLPSTFSSGG